MDPTVENALSKGDALKRVPKEFNKKPPADEDSPDNIFDTTGIEKNKKLMSVYEVLKNTDTFRKLSKLVKYNEGLKTEFRSQKKIVLTLGDNLDRNALAETSDDSRKITFSNSFISSGMEICIAGTFMHELCHSLLTKYAFEDDLVARRGVIDDANKLLIDEYMDLSGLLYNIRKYVDTYGINDETSGRDWEHNYMAENMRQFIINAVREFDVSQGVLKREGEIIVLIPFDGRNQEEETKLIQAFIAANPGKTVPVEMILSNKYQSKKFDTSLFYTVISFLGLDGTESQKNLSEEDKVTYSSIQQAVINFYFNTKSPDSYLNNLYDFNIIFIK